MTYEQFNDKLAELSIMNPSWDVAMAILSLQIAIDKIPEADKKMFFDLFEKSV